MVTSVNCPYDAGFQSERFFGTLKSSHGTQKITSIYIQHVQSLLGFAPHLHQNLRPHSELRSLSLTTDSSDRLEYTKKRRCSKEQK